MQARICVMSFSGNVGKSTIARHLLVPRIKDAEIIAIETINSDALEGGEVAKGNQWGQIQEFLMTADSAIVDVGASNVETLTKLMKQYEGSHEEFDFFVLPVTPDVKQQKDTIATIEMLASLGVTAKKIRIIFNRVEDESELENQFAGLINYGKTTKRCKVCAKPVLFNELYGKVKDGKITAAALAEDQTDYRAGLRSAQTEEEKDHCKQMISLQRLAKSANRNLDEVFAELFKA